MQFARNVQFVLKTGKLEDFNRIYKNDVLPMLQKQNGFQQAMTLHGKSGGLGISLWADRAAADTYATATFPKVMEKLGPVIEGTPTVNSYDVGITTLSA